MYILKIRVEGDDLLIVDLFHLSYYTTYFDKKVKIFLIENNYFRFFIRGVQLN
jgi:hypothetical protein